MSSCPASLLPLACQPVAMSDAEHFYEDDSCGDEEEEEEEDEEDGLQFSSDEVRNRCLLWGGMMVYFFQWGLDNPRIGQPELIVCIFGLFRKGRRETVL